MFEGVFQEVSMADLINPKKGGEGYENKRKGKLIYINAHRTIQEAQQNGLIVRLIGWENKENPKVIVIRQHYIYDPESKFSNKKRFITCLGNGCPLCAIGNHPIDKYATIVEHMNSRVTDTNGSSFIKAQRKILLTSKSVMNQLYIKSNSMNKNLSQVYLLLSALEGKPANNYIIEYKGDYDPNIEVEMNDLSNMEILRPNSYDIKDAQRLGKQSESNHNSGYTGNIKPKYVANETINQAVYTQVENNGFQNKQNQYANKPNPFADNPFANNTLNNVPFNIPSPNNYNDNDTNDDNIPF